MVDIIRIYTEKKDWLLHNLHSKIWHSIFIYNNQFLVVAANF